MVTSKRLKATNLTRNIVLAEEVKLANNFFTRLRGLLFTDSLANGHGLLIKPCNSIHAIGMTYAIDALFLDKENTVVGILPDFQPWKVSAIFFRAHSCLELPANTINKSGTTLGDRLEFSGSN